MAAFFVVTFIVALLAAYNLRTRRPWDFWIVHTGVHTEYYGPGRVRFVSFLRGAGYCTWLTQTFCIPGFTLYIRTARSRSSTSYGRGKPVRWIRLTRNANQPII